MLVVKAVIILFFLIPVAIFSLFGFFMFFIIRFRRTRKPDLIAIRKPVIKAEELQSEVKQPDKYSQREPSTFMEPTFQIKKPVREFLVVNKIIKLLQEYGIFNSLSIYAVSTLVVYIVNLEVFFRIFSRGSFSFLAMFTEGYNLFYPLIYLIIIVTAWFVPFWLLFRPRFYGKRFLIEPFSKKEMIVLIGNAAILVLVIFIFFSLYFFFVTLPAFIISLFAPFKAIKGDHDNSNVVTCNNCKYKVGVYFEGKITQCPNCNHIIEYDLIPVMIKIIGQLLLSLFLSLSFLLLFLSLIIVYLRF